MLSAQTVTELKVYKNSCNPGEEWNGWQSVSRPYFSYNFSMPFTNVQIRVSNTPYGGTYDQDYTFNNGNKCNQWPFDLPTGRYTWRVRVYYQKAPDPPRWSDFTVGPDFYVDVDPPSAPVVTEHHCGGSNTGWPAWTTHTTPYFTWDASSDAGSGISHYQVLVYSTWNTVSSGWHPEYEGRKAFAFRAVDNAGNVSPGYNIYVRIDNTPPPSPSVSETHCGMPGVWTAHTSPWFSWMPVLDAGEITGDGSGINRYEVSVNEGSWNAVTPGWHPTYGTGQYNFKFRSVDNVGLVSSLNVISGIYIDDTPPQKPTVTEEHCGGTTSENPPWSTHTSPYFSFTIPSDEGSGVLPDGCQVSVNSGSWTTVFPGWHPELNKGSYRFDFRATDRVGHTSETFRLYVRINPGNRIYVKHDATGNSDGSSWENAFTSLQAALSSALENDTIWIAKGIYKPSADKNGDPNPADPRTKTFKLVSKVPLYGGFSGNETSLKARNPFLNLTYLSGDIGTEGDNADNCYSVITGVNNAAVDGFIITGGNGNGTVSLETDLGGGISNNGISKIKVSNCIFKTILQNREGQPEIISAMIQ